jgi:hypothetical protein
VAEVIGDLIDASSVRGGTFELGSEAFAMTRIVTGQFHEFQISSICAANAELHSRLVREVDAGVARLREVM